MRNKMRGDEERKPKMKFSKAPTASLYINNRSANHQCHCLRQKHHPRSVSVSSSALYEHTYTHIHSRHDEDDIVRQILIKMYIYTQINWIKIIILPQLDVFLTVFVAAAYFRCASRSFFLSRSPALLAWPKSFALSLLLLVSNAKQLFSEPIFVYDWKPTSTQTVTMKTKISTGKEKTAREFISGSNALTRHWLRAQATIACHWWRFFLSFRPE